MKTIPSILASPFLVIGWLAGGVAGMILFNMIIDQIHLVLMPSLFMGWLVLPLRILIYILFTGIGAFFTILIVRKVYEREELRRGLIIGSLAQDHFVKFIPYLLWRYFMLGLSMGLFAVGLYQIGSLLLRRLFSL